MKRKIFISINIPDRVKKRLIFAVEKWQGLPVKWIRQQNLHVTLFFLGYVAEDNLAKICEKVDESVRDVFMFDLEFDQITLSPNEKDPRLIWLSGNPSKELLLLYEKIEKGLGIFEAYKKTFRPHITLGRIRKEKWKNLEEKPNISEKFHMSVSIESVDVMASDFSDGENEYVVIESSALK